MILTKETHITCTMTLDAIWPALSEAQHIAIDTKRDEMVAEGKTDGIQYANPLSDTGIRRWTDNFSATEWITHIENTIDPSLIVAIAIVDVSN